METRYISLDTRSSMRTKGGFIVAIPVSLMGEASTVWLASLITLRAFGFVMTLLAVNWSFEIDRGHYLGNALPLLWYKFETGRTPDVVAT